MTALLFAMLLLGASLTLGWLADSDALDLPPLLSTLFALGPVILLMILCFLEQLAFGGFALLGFVSAEGVRRGRLHYLIWRVTSRKGSRR